MSIAADTLSGKSHRDENFPVASWLMAARHRGPILAFYRFARAADDIADHATLGPDEKIARLDAMGAALTGETMRDEAAEPLRRALAQRGLAPDHALDLLTAFRLDARKTRYATWEELMAYCRLSAAPVGRFVLDVHGEDRALWPASDALCAALQVINHLQDCGDDFRALDRVYLPQDTLDRHGATAAMLGGEQAPPPLRAAVAELAHKASALTQDGSRLVRAIVDTRLGFEIAAIASLARHLSGKLERLDPLSGGVHHGKAAYAWVAGLGMLRHGASKLAEKSAARAGRAA